MATNISTYTEFQAMNALLSEDYILQNALLKSDSDYATVAGPSANGGLGFNPIGVAATPFTGTLDGGGFTVEGLTVDRPSMTYAGIFGATNGVTISSLLVLDPVITGAGYTGALIGNAQSGAASTVTDVGIINPTVVGGSRRVGGMCGQSATHGFTRCFVLGGSVVSSSSRVGGFTGAEGGGAGSFHIDCYSTASTNGTGEVAGYCGYNFASVTYTNCFSTGFVISGGTSGGFLYDVSSATGVNCFWDTQTSGQGTSSIGTGKTTAEMQTESTFTGWDFTTVWVMDGYPELQWAYVPSEAAIPNLSNLSLSSAQSAITSAGFLYGGASYTCTNDFPPDIVLTQSPNAGELRALGSYVFVNVSCEDISTSSVLGREFTIKDQYGELIAAGITSKGFEVSNSPVDITSDDSEGWQAFMNKPGGKSVSLDIQGVFSDNLLKNYSMLGGNIKLLAVEINDTKNTLTGDFIVTAYSNAVAVNDAVRMSATLQLSGELYS